MLDIKELYAELAEDNKAILKGVSLAIKPGEVHAVMGPNGAGKSTLGYVLAGREDYTVTTGNVTMDGQDLLEMDADARARAGLFLAFQYPVELPGVNVASFLRTCLNAKRAENGEEPMNAAVFLKLARAEMATLGMSDNFLQRFVNVGFSGGEKKRLEMLQMALLAPKYAILDETDSGLDIDALRIVAEGVNRVREKGTTGFLIITHYQRLLDYIKPDFVHVFADGKIVKSGGMEIAEALEKEGYSGVVAA
ncbi:MAG: Fe-S cluster assembly ATPase SufC [Alphaproteobacteria bacterium CG_4_10_14_0_8_um_filter_53_9]|nr:MAG: Fe-S cluster assembly ATPase SufC [Alphaproteobacteria bacterium CG_4_10_14_0_8_um_filter_53_9]